MPELFDRWPKVRDPLPEPYLAVYEEHMRGNRQAGTILNRAALGLEAWMHRRVAEVPGQTLLELGAGGLNHVRYEPTATRYDVIEPLAPLVTEHELARSGRVCYLGGYDELVRLARAGAPGYDKVVSVAVLEHLDELPLVLAATACLLRPGGAVVAGIPSEGGRLWRWSWKASTGVLFRRRYGLDYSVLMGWEHINSAVEIQAVARAIFRDVRVRSFPGPGVDSSLYQALACRDPDLDVARRILAARPD